MTCLVYDVGVGFNITHWPFGSSIASLSAKSMTRFNRVIDDLSLDGRLLNDIIGR